MFDKLGNSRKNKTPAKHRGCLAAQNPDPAPLWMLSRHGVPTNGKITSLLIQT